MQLEPGRAGLEAAERLAERVVPGIQPGQRRDPSVRRARELEHALVGLAVPTRLLEGEDDAVGAREGERRDRLLLGREETGRISQPDVHVHVDEIEVWQPVAQNGESGGEEILGVHGDLVPRRSRATRSCGVTTDHLGAL